MNQPKTIICPGCNRALRSKKSIAKGIGPVCERKLENLENEPDDDQLKMELKDRE
ncbi:DUF6011 domain-containing protein [Cytobacillus oceanisediminis]|uniref:DUF6011 domain-containing protein n=1 Tax=Cytobacillus oceanisediminis TaxID=665099 RepID=UPI00207A334C|nr:DUF6011 domain-containing protein [Cytobacillus oceanisediminis]USK47085.1 DUF6011 domain-containing protein [Cytobacillus oceanisediminis]